MHRLTSICSLTTTPTPRRKSRTFHRHSFLGFHVSSSFHSLLARPRSCVIEVSYPGISPETRLVSSNAPGFALLRGPPLQSLMTPRSDRAIPVYCTSSFRTASASYLIDWLKAVQSPGWDGGHAGCFIQVEARLGMSLGLVCKLPYPKKQGVGRRRDGPLYEPTTLLLVAM
jgi:hypothetical protein